MTKIIIEDTSDKDVKRLIFNIKGDTKGFKVSSKILKNTAEKLDNIFSEDLK